MRKRSLTLFRGKKKFPSLEQQKGKRNVPQLLRHEGGGKSLNTREGKKDGIEKNKKGKRPARIRIRKNGPSMYFWEKK